MVFLQTIKTRKRTECFDDTHFFQGVILHNLIIVKHGIS